MKLRHAALSGAILLGAVGSNASSALAWGCVAQGNGTAYGYSYNYSSRSAAMQRAVYECRRRPRAGSCYVTSCNPRR